MAFLYFYNDFFIIIRSIEKKISNLQYIYKKKPSEPTKMTLKAKNLKVFQWVFCLFIMIISLLSCHFRDNLVFYYIYKGYLRTYQHVIYTTTPFKRCVQYLIAIKTTLLLCQWKHCRVFFLLGWHIRLLVAWLVFCDVFPLLLPLVTLKLMLVMQDFRVIF